MSKGTYTQPTLLKTVTALCMLHRFVYQDSGLVYLCSRFLTNMAVIRNEVQSSWELGCKMCLVFLETM